jgi:hypothetical protein
MNLEIEHKGIEVFLKLPKRQSRTPFQLAVSQVLMREVKQANWRDINSCEPAEIALPITSWRQAIGRLQDDWNYWRQPENYGDVFNTGSFKDVVFDLSPMTFSLNGSVYEDAKDVPSPPDVAYGLGTFILATPTLLVTDPCYKKGTWCTGELQARPGEWATMVIKRPFGSGHRNAVLLIAHTSVDIRNVVLGELTDSGVVAGVDSAQAGFFEKDRYPKDKAQLEYEDGTWYRAVANQALNDERANASVAPGRFGAVSQTFWGDGSYPCLVRKDTEGQVIVAALIFDGSFKSDEDDGPVVQAVPERPAPIYVASLIPEDYSALEVMPSPPPAPPQPPKKSFF